MRESDRRSPAPIGRGRNWDRPRIAWTVLTAAGLLLGLVLFVTGVTPWPAPAAVLVCLTLAIGQRTSWPFALAAAVIVELALIALIVRFTPSLGLGLVNGAAIVLGLLGAAALAAFCAVRQPRLLGVRALRVGIPLISIPVTLVAVVAVRSRLSGDLEWAMRNDAVWNLVTTRLIVADGGLDAIAHPNASPLTPGLLAVAIAVGRGGIAAENLLAHDVGRVATFWLLMTLAAGLLAALIGARSVHGGTRIARLVGAALAALVPFSWFTFGFASQFGFYNATVTLVLLLATWLAWLETRVAPVAGTAVLSLATVALLATWAPLAAIPFVLAAAAIVSRLSAELRTARGLRSILIIAATAAPIPLYALAVTLPDLLREGAALAVDGGIMPLQPVHVMVIGAVTVGVCVLNAVQRRQLHQLNGVLLVCAAGIIAAGYLIGQRIAAGASTWGYYPAKFSWLLVSLLLVVLASALAGEMAGLRGRPFAAAGTAAVAIVVPASLMLLVPPDAPRVASALTPVAIATNTGVAAGSPAARHLFDLAVPGERTIAAGYLTPEQDRFLNSWLLQLESNTARDPIRAYAYALDPRNVPQVCDAARVWGGSVRIVTSSDATAASLSAACPDAYSSLDIRRP